MVNDSSNQELERWRVKGNVQKKTIPGTGSSIRQNGDKKRRKKRRKNLTAASNIPYKRYCESYCRSFEYTLFKLF